MLDPETYFLSTKTVDAEFGNKPEKLVANRERLEGGCLLYRPNFSDDKGAADASAKT